MSTPCRPAAATARPASCAGLASIGANDDRISRERFGAALCTHGFENGWIRRIDGTRAVTVTPKGERILREQLGVQVKG